MKTANRLGAAGLAMGTAALIILSLSLSACGSSGGGAVTATGNTADINMKNTAFDPTDLTVNKGTTVTWTNSDGVAHTVTANGGQFDSGRMSGGQTFSFTFNETGTFDYRCTIHSNMKGTVTVK